MQLILCYLAIGLILSLCDHARVGIGSKIGWFVFGIIFWPLYIFAFLRRK